MPACRLRRAPWCGPSSSGPQRRQAALGVATLLMHVPVALGSAHQAGALAVMSVTVALLHSLRSPAAVAAAAQRLAASGVKI